jgi:hypothetical protein
MIKLEHMERSLKHGAAYLSLLGPHRPSPLISRGKALYACLVNTRTYRIGLIRD